LKFVLPVINGVSLSRASEMVTGVLVPVSILALFEIWLRIKNQPSSEFDNYQRYMLEKSGNISGTNTTIVDSEGENRFGKRMISIGILSIGIIIGVLGAIAENGRYYTLGISAILLMISIRILMSTLNKKEKNI
jgi:hypothetical protein